MNAPVNESLAKATLFKLKEKAGGNAKKTPRVETDGKGIAVQFNPTSLKISYTNESTGGPTTGAQNRQSTLEGHATLTFDLEFDTAEGKDGRPRDVREETAAVLQFVRPSGDDKQVAPPRIRFVWGNIQFNGVVNSINEDLDYFDADGRALRSKLSVSIKEQNLAYEANESGPGARVAALSVKPGEAPTTGGPGSAPTKNPERSEPAQAGESVQQALTRLDADPAQWRTAMAGFDSPLGLAAGAQIQLGAEASASAGVGVSGGFGAEAAVTPGTSVGGSVGASAEATAGFALSASGGIEKSVTRVASGQVKAGLDRARAGFVVPGVTVVGVSARAEIGVDPRALTYGWAVPLRPRIRDRSQRSGDGPPTTMRGRRGR